MNESRYSRLPTGLFLLLFYHGILVLISLGYSVVGMVELDSSNRLFGGPFQVVTFSCCHLGPRRLGARNDLRVGWNSQAKAARIPSGNDRPSAS
jgi:hypothetical protein